MNKKVLSLILNNKNARKLAPEVGKAMLDVKRVSPELLLGAGIAAAVVAGVMFARAHKKAEETFEDLQEEIQDVKHFANPTEVLEDGEATITSEETVQLLMPLYGQMVGRAIRLYGPSLAVGGLSLYLLLTSHGLLKGRNKSLVAALTITEQAFMTYRRRVVEAEGEEKDQQYRYGLQERITTVVGIGEDGKKTSVKTKSLERPAEFTPAMYEMIWDHKADAFNRQAGMNQIILEATQRHFNVILDLRGYVMLNEVLRELGLPDKSYGQLVGWSKTGKGDNFVDFGLDKPINFNAQQLQSWVLDFNVNGSVYEDIPD